MKNAYELYIYYIALKRHFNTSYDFHKYNGRVKSSIDAFEKRNDKYTFIKLSKKDYAEELILSNIQCGTYTWIGDIDTKEGKEIYHKWKSRQMSLAYSFKEDLLLLSKDLNEIIIVDKDNYPTLLRSYNKGDISKETLIILNDIIGFMHYWNKRIKDDVIWPLTYFNLKKYSGFVKYDSNKFRNIIKDYFGYK